MKCCLCRQPATLTLVAPIAVDLVPVDGEPDVLAFENYNERFPVCSLHFSKLVEMSPKVRANLFSVLKMARPEVAGD
jgi:hypothetical protein